MCFEVNLKMKKPTLSCCFKWILFIELDFKVAFLLINNTWDDWFAGKIVCTPPPHLLGGGRVSHLPNFKKERLDRILVFRGGILGKRGLPFLGGFSFYMKNKLKSNISQQKDGIGLKKKNLNIMGLHWKIFMGTGGGGH